MDGVSKYSEEHTSAGTVTHSSDLVVGLDTSIYGMPAFVTLRVADLDASVRWYTEGLGLHLLATLGRRADGRAALVHLRRWRYQDLLLVPSDPPAAIGGAVTVSFAAGQDELAGLAEQARRTGGGRVAGPAMTACGTADLSTTDPDGHILVFTARPVRPATADRLPGFTMTVHPDPADAPAS